MQNLFKKGLVSLMLGFATISALDSHNLYSFEQNKNYSNKTSTNYPENEGFSSEGLVYVGIITLGAYWGIRKISKIRNKQ